MESLQSSLESCQLFSFFGEMLLNDRCYRNLHAIQNGKQKMVAPSRLSLSSSAKSPHFYNDLSNLSTPAFLEGINK